MFASQLSGIMSAVLRISKKYPDMDIKLKPYGTPMPDDILAAIIEDLDKRLDQANARLEAAQAYIKDLSSAPAKARDL